MSELRFYQISLFCQAIFDVFFSMYHLPLYDRALIVYTYLMKSPPRISPPPVMWVFFSVGLLSAIAFRFLIVFYHTKAEMVRPVWYIGIFGYTLFFFYRYGISRKRKRAVNEFRLLEKISDGECLKDNDREAAKYLFRSIIKSKEDVNYLVIFVLSIAAIFIDLILQAGGK